MAGAKPIFRHLSRSSSHRRALLRNLVTSLIQHESIATTWHKAKEAQRIAEKVITLGKRNTPAARTAASKHLFYLKFKETVEVKESVNGEEVADMTEEDGVIRAVNREKDARVVNPEGADQKQAEAEELIDEEDEAELQWHNKEISRSVLDKIFNELRKRYAKRPGGYTRVLRIEPLKEDQAPSALLELVDGPKDMRFAMTAMTIAKTRERNHQINDMTAANIMKVTRFREGGEEKLEQMAQKFSQMFEAGDHGDEEVKKKKVYHPVPDSR